MNHTEQIHIDIIEFCLADLCNVLESRFLNLKVEYSCIRSDELNFFSIANKKNHPIYALALK